MTIKLNVNVILFFYFISFILLLNLWIGKLLLLKIYLFYNSQLVAKKAKILKLDNNTISEYK